MKSLSFGGCYKKTKRKEKNTIFMKQKEHRTGWIDYI